MQDADTKSHLADAGVALRAYDSFLPAVRDLAAKGSRFMLDPTPPPSSLPYKVDTSRPSLRTNRTRLVHSRFMLDPTKTSWAVFSAIEVHAPTPQPTSQRAGGAPAAHAAGRCRPPPPPLPRTKWTRRVPHPVLIGHAASLTGR